MLINWFHCRDADELLSTQLYFNVIWCWKGSAKWSDYSVL